MNMILNVNKYLQKPATPVLKICLVCLFLLVFISRSHAQDKNKIHFRSATSVGFVAGEKNNAFVAETVNGIAFSNWSAGVGVGIDLYEINSIPVFADLKYHFGKNKQAFVYGNIGPDLPLKVKSDRKVWNGSYHYRNGVFAGAGIGYKVLLGKKKFLFFDAGYSYKRMNESGSYTICGIAPPCYTYYEKYEYNYRRIKFKMGFGF